MLTLTDGPKDNEDIENERQLLLYKIEIEEKRGVERENAVPIS